VIFKARVKISMTTADSARRWARGGSTIELPARHQRRMKKMEMPITAAKDAAVNAQRFHVMRDAGLLEASTSLHLNAVYATCLHCHRALGSNESIEAFPVGRRLAFDAAKGRLWVICPSCERWNLSPIEERWEAVEGCE